MDFTLTREQHLLQSTIKDFNRSEIEPLAGKIDNEGYLPDRLIHKMAEINLPGMTLPLEFGGSGASLLDCILAIEQLSYSGCGAWWYVAFTNSISECIVKFGTNEQKQAFLPAICSGNTIPSIQFTEDITGSDPSLLHTTSLQKEDHYIINGTKRFSTFGNRPGHTILYTRDDDGKCTAFLVKKFSEGYSTSNIYELMGSGGIEAVDVYYDNVILPSSAILGDKNNGFFILLLWIAIEKIQQCAACLGIAQASLDLAIHHATSRALRQKSQAELQGIQFMIAEMYAQLQAARWNTYRTAFLKDTNSLNWQAEAAAAKLHVVDTSIKIVELGRRIIGANGYVKGQKIERLYRAIAGASAIATSLEINKSVVARYLIKKQF
jgi:alkylation response protein AidB-like acyl-CoA dehydrogenase